MKLFDDRRRSLSVEFIAKSGIDVLAHCVPVLFIHRGAGLRKGRLLFSGQLCNLHAGILDDLPEAVVGLAGGGDLSRAGLLAALLDRKSVV